MKYALAILLTSLTLFALPTIAETTLVEQVKNTSFDADYYPGGDPTKHGIIILNGSGGTKWTSMAQRLAHHGHSVLALSYFNRGTDNGIVPNSLEMIPLEYFDAPKAWLKKQKETSNDGVILIGLSKGAELALVLSAHDSDYSGVIGLSPSTVVWAGIPKKMSTIMSAPSSWSYKGKGLPFVPYVTMSNLLKTGLKDKTSDRHIASIAAYNNVEKALINVEKIDSSILVLSGGRDDMWPANEMAANICERANLNQKVANCTHFNYENASHVLGLTSQFDKNLSLSGDADLAFNEMLNFLNKVNQ